MLLSVFSTLTAVAETPFAPQHDPIKMGTTKLSKHFSVELSDSIFSPRLLRAFLHDGGRKTLIGVTKISEHASRQNGYAVSEDGKTLLYFHQNLPSEKGIEKPSGLYEYQYGRTGDAGPDLIRQTLVANTAYLPAKVPDNTIVFTKLVKKQTTLIVEGNVYILNTDGQFRQVWPP